MSADTKKVNPYKETQTVKVKSTINSYSQPHLKNKTQNRNKIPTEHT